MVLKQFSVRLKKILLVVVIVQLTLLCLFVTRNLRTSAVEDTSEEHHGLAKLQDSRHESEPDSQVLNVLLPPPNGTRNTSNVLLPASVSATKKGNELLPVDSEKRYSGRTYLASLEFWEQLTQGSRSMAYLQCLASALNVPNLSFVEPFMGKKSSQYLNFYFNNVTVSHVQFKDCFDFEEWSSSCTKYGLAPMISLEEFLAEANSYNKLVVLIQLTYEVSMQEDIIQDCKLPGWKLATNFSLNHVIDDNVYSRFTVAKRMCINAKKFVSMARIKEAIFEGVGYKDVFVVFTEWRSVGRWRSDLSCPRADEFVSQHRRVSPRVISNAETYVERFGLKKFNEYIAILGRFEIPVPNYVMPQEQRKQKVVLRVGETLAKLEQVKKETGLDRVVLGFDYGKFGSETFRYHSFYGASEALEKFQNDVYNGQMSYSEWEDTFRNVTFPRTGNGPVALLQMTLAARSRCVIAVGYGSWLMYSLDQHRKYHQSTGTQPCIYYVPSRN